MILSNKNECALTHLDTNSVQILKTRVHFWSKSSKFVCAKFRNSVLLEI